jgi:hypothetical protein
VSKTLIQNGATERIGVKLVDASGSPITGQSANIAISIRNTANGNYWSGSAFGASFATVNPTEISSSNEPGAYDYAFTSNVNNILCEINARTTAAGASVKEWGPDYLQVGGLPGNFGDLSIAPSTGIVSIAQQSIADSLKLAPVAGAPAFGSVYSSLTSIGNSQNDLNNSLTDLDAAITDQFHTTWGTTNAGQVKNLLILFNTISGGGADINAIRDAVWNAVLSNYVTAGTAGAALGAVDVSALEPIVNNLIEEIAKIALPILTAAQIRGKMWVGQKGDLIKLPMYRDGQLETVTPDTGTVKMRFEKIGTDEADVIVNATFSGGMISYTTIVGDGTRESAGRWRQQGSAEFSGKIRYTEDEIVDVFVPV